MVGWLGIELVFGRWVFSASILCVVAASAAGQSQPSQPPQSPASPPAAASSKEVEPAPASSPSAELEQASRGLPGQAPTDPMPPTGVEEELDEIRPGVAIKRRFDALAVKSNLRLGVAHTMLLQQASGGPGHRTAASGDLDLLAKWTAIGAGTKDTGLLAFAAEYRYQIGALTPSALGGEIGTLLGTTNGFSERPMVVKEAYWDQRLLEDRLRFAVGRIDPENLFGGHRLQSANTFFFNKAFSTNPTVAYPGSGVAAAALVKPAPWAYVDGGITDANGKVTVGNLEGFFEDHEYLTFAEGGLTPTIDGVGAGRYRLAVWHIDAREDAGKPSDQGFTLSFDQDIGDSLICFVRYGNADGDVTGVTNSVQGGAGIKNVLGEDNMLGLAAAWSRPADDTERDEKVIEVFQRFQVTETVQFTVGAEMIIDPSNAPGDDVLGVFSVRLRVSF